VFAGHDRETHGDGAGLRGLIRFLMETGTPPPALLFHGAALRDVGPSGKAVTICGGHGANSVGKNMPVLNASAFDQ